MQGPSWFTAGKFVDVYTNVFFVVSTHKNVATHKSHISLYPYVSAGVGRTGTFIVIDAMLDMMNSERKVDVFGFVTRIRAQRCQMVQTDVSPLLTFRNMLQYLASVTVESGTCFQ